MAFSVRPESINLPAIASDKRGFHFVVTNGEVLPADGKMQGYPDVLVKPDVLPKSLSRATTCIGTTQHWALVPRDARGGVS